MSVEFLKGLDGQVWRIEGQAQCDFCSARPIAHVYGCRDFAMPLGSGMSRSGWAACADCKKLIDGERWIALEDRAVKAFADPFDGPRAEQMLRRLLRMTWQDFRTLRKEELVS
jgi:hypothetical protein